MEPTKQLMREIALKREPTYFAVCETVEFPPSLVLEYCSFTGSLFAVRISEAELEDPRNEPIGVFGNGKGERCYLWRDQYWQEYPVHMMHLVRRSDKLGEVCRALSGSCAVGAVPQPYWCVLYDYDRQYRSNNETNYGNSSVPITASADAGI